MRLRTDKAASKWQARATGPGLQGTATQSTSATGLARLNVSRCTCTDQAAGLNSFDALLLIGSMVSEAIFWLSSPNSLAWAA